MGISRARCRAVVRHVATLALGVAACRAGLPAAAPGRLIYAAIIARHGVRSPTWTADRLRQWSSEAWPDFGVEPGNLTPRGRALIGLLGTYYRDWLAHEGLAADDCEDGRRAYIWADSAERTLETGRALAETIWPGCAVPVHSVQGDGKDPLFNAFSVPGVHVDAAGIAAALRARVAAAAPAFTRLRPSFDALQRILTAGAPSDHHFGDQGWDTVVTTAASGADLTGPLATASTLSEVLLLEYAEGLAGHDLAWGRLDAATLTRVLELHTLYADLARRTPAIARPRASNLLAHLAWSIEQALTAQPVAGALGTPATRVLVIAGHDTNLSNIAGALDLTWHLPGYPTDDTPPGGALIFTVRSRTGRPSPADAVVAMRYVAQTPDEMHDATPLSMASPPASVAVEWPVCRAAAREGGCPWPVVEKLLAQAIDPSFVLRK